MCFFFKTEGIPITIQIYPLAPIDCVSFPFSPCLQSSHILWCLSQTDSEFAPRENFFTITHMTSLLHCGSNRERSICCSIYLAHSMCSIKIHLLNKKQGTGHFHTGKHGNQVRTWRLCTPSHVPCFMHFFHLSGAEVYPLTMNW